MAIFDKSKDYKKLQKDVLKANKRIRNIEHAYGKESWAINQLYDKIKDGEMVNGINKRGLIRINKNMSEAQLKLIQKSTKEFLDSKTSKLTGIKEVTRDVKDSLRATLGDFREKDLSWKEINFLYDLVEDKNKRDLTEQIGASNLWTTLVEAKERGDKFSEDKFFQSLLKGKSNVVLSEEDMNTLEDIWLKYSGKM